jgi:hypothetical protein
LIGGAGTIRTDWLAARREDPIPPMNSREWGRLHSFESAALAANAEKCPACEQVRGYDKDDYFFGEGIGS